MLNVKFNARTLDSSESPEGRYDPGRKLPDSSEWGASGTHGVLHTVGGVV